MKKELKQNLTLRIKNSTREVLEEAAEEKGIRVTALRLGDDVRQNRLFRAK